MTKAYKTTKPATKEKGHKRLGYVNNNGLDKMIKMATRISFLKGNSNTELEFCEACTLGKLHKLHSKEPPIEIITDEPGIRLYFFRGRNTLPGIGSYRYGAILAGDATHMRFPIMANSKDAICEESKVIFNKIETFGKKMQYFRSDDAGGYQLLVPYFEEKGIIRGKSALMLKTKME